MTRSGQTRPARYWLYTAALLAALFSLSCALVTRSLPRALDAGDSPGLIAYVGTDGNIYTIGREGGQPTAITTDANTNPGTGDIGRIYQFPTWALDGQRLAYIGLSSSSPADAQAILHTASPDGKDSAAVFTSQEYFPFYLSWSPDSHYVTFLSNSPDGSGLSLHLVAVQDGNSQVIGIGQPYYWDWSPDSREIVTHTGGPASINPLARMALWSLAEPGRQAELKLKPGFFQAPAWSPDGDTLVLAAEGEVEAELLLAGRDGSIQRVLARVSGPVAFAWSPDGRQLAYTASTAGDPQSIYSSLALVDPERPEERKEIATQAFVVAFFWSPDSRKIAYFTPNLEEDNPGGVTRNISQTGPRLGLRVLVYDLDSQQTRQAAVFEPTDSFIQIIPFFDQYQRSGTLWSPDSRNLVLSAVDAEGISRIVVAGVDGGPLQLIAEGELAFWSWK
jgi:Tol biopolymer transport system component